MLRKICAVLAIVAVVALEANVFAAEGTDKKQPVQQGAFAARLVEALGWGDGIPESPKDKDYQAVLSGVRNYRFEAEEFYDRAGDVATVRTYKVFGPYSGKGWLSGISSQTSIHFKVFLPLAGTYTLKVAGKGDGQLWSVGGRGFKANCGNSFSVAQLGKVTLPAGTFEFNAVLPPDGAIDYVDFSAPSYAPIEPSGGWDFSGLLTQHHLAEVTAALLGLEDKLPKNKRVGTKNIHVASTVELPSGVTTTTNEHLGKFFAPKWIRVGTDPVSFDLPIGAEEPAVYGVRVRFVGSELTASLAGRDVVLTGKPYLDWLDLGTFRLTKGTHTLHLALPPFGGIDVVEVTPRESSPADYLAAAQLTGAAAQPVLTGQVDDILISLVDRFKERR